MTGKIGFDNDKYLKEQTEEILKRVEKGLDKDPQGTEWPKSLYDFILNRV